MLSVVEVATSAKQQTTYNKILCQLQNCFSGIIPTSRTTSTRTRASKRFSVCNKINIQTLSMHFVACNFQYLLAIINSVITTNMLQRDYNDFFKNCFTILISVQDRETAAKQTLVGLITKCNNSVK